MKYYNFYNLVNSKNKEIDSNLPIFNFFVYFFIKFLFEIINDIIIKIMCYFMKKGIF